MQPLIMLDSSSSVPRSPLPQIASTFADPGFSFQINAIGLEPEKASLVLGGLGIAGLAACIFGCFICMEKRELVFFSFSLPPRLPLTLPFINHSRSCQAHDGGSTPPLHWSSFTRRRCRQCRYSRWTLRSCCRALPLRDRLLW